MNDQYIHLELSPTLSLSECTNQKNGSFGFWLYDESRGMNLSMRAKTERDAFVEALEYYQERLKEVEEAHKLLTQKVEAFVAHFVPEDDGNN